MSDPTKLQAALDDAMKDNIGGEFRSLITNLIEARSRHPSQDALTEDQAVLTFTKMTRMIWETYLKASDILAKINATPPAAQA